MTGMHVVGLAGPALEDKDVCGHLYFHLSLVHSTNSYYECHLLGVFRDR